MKYRHLNSRCVVDQEGCERNLISVLARNLPIIDTDYPARTDQLAIVAAGPSVPDFLDEIRRFDNVWAVNGAYHYLIDQGIIPNGFVGIDPLPGLAEYLTDANHETTFYMSAQCDPAVFDVLAGHNIKLWMPEQDGIKVDGKNIPVLLGGSTAVTRAAFVAKHIGFRDLTVFGVDSSFAKVADNGGVIKGVIRYCYDRQYAENSKAEIKWIECNGEGPFPTEICLASQVSQLADLERFPWGVKFSIRCGGLMDAYLRAPTETEDGVYAA